MKLNYKYEGLRVAILGLFSVAMLIYMSVVANAEQVYDKMVTSKPDIQLVRSLFFLNGNEAPSFWGNPVVPTFYDATAKHDELLNKAEIFALYYAGASKVKTINDEGVNQAPTLAFVIADHKIEDLHLAQPLKSVLSEKWKDTPISDALNGKVLRYLVNGIFDGTNCSLFITAIQKSNPSHYQVNSAVIIANSSMSGEDILLCFKNKMVLTFGLAITSFDKEQIMASRPRDYLYFGYYPAFLNISSTCRIANAQDILGCVGYSANFSYWHMLNALSYK